MNSDFGFQFLYEERAARLRAEAARDRLTREALRGQRAARPDRSARRVRRARRLALARLARSAGGAHRRRQPAL